MQTKDHLESLLEQLNKDPEFSGLSSMQSTGMYQKPRAEPAASNEM